MIMLIVMMSWVRIYDHNLNLTKTKNTGLLKRWSASRLYTCIRTRKFTNKRHSTKDYIKLAKNMKTWFSLLQSTYD